MPESNRIEYKQKLTDDLEKEVVAFLNYREGGFIYIGIDKQEKAVGVTDIDQLQLTVKDRLKDNIVPSCMGLFDLIAMELDGKDILKIIVASGSEKPYYVRKYGMSPKGCFIRVGSSANPMTEAMIETLFAKRIRNSLRKIKSPKQKLTFEQLKIYYEARGKNLTGQFAANLELLNEDGDYNYVAYLLADINVTSIKVAKYSGLDRYELSENNEYGNCSLIKATKSVLDKFDIENKTYARITHKERLERPLWNRVALREAILNAIVHNDYTNEAFPKFEIFDDRVEITSYGGLPENLSEEEFFEGISRPRNKELMRIFRDVELVEYLGSGMPRILRAYDRAHFIIRDSYIRMVFPKDASFGKADNDQIDDTVEEQVREQVGIQVGEQVNKLLSNIGYEAYSITDLMTKIGLKSRPKFFSRYIQPALQAGLVEMTIPEKPNSRLQKYRLTVSGVELKSQLEKNREQDNEHIREQVGIQVGEQVNKLLSNIGYEAYSITDLMTKIGLKNRPKFFSRYIQPALQAGLVEMTIPEKPNSRLQKYRLTVSGVELKSQLEKNREQDNEHIGEQVGIQVGEQVNKLLSNIGYEAYSITDLMTKIGLKNRPKFFSRYIQPALQAGLVEMTIPEKPNSRLQKYRLTVSGVELKRQLIKP